jgi:eukaryotic-like serine/threonine-protein kinase
MASGEDVAVPPHDGAAGVGCAVQNAPIWDRVKEVLQGALDRPAHERAAWLHEICGEDRALQAEVESLLTAHDEAGSFAERPAVELLGQLTVEMDISGSIGRLMHPGYRLGAYEILSLLGAGGMGEVYRARDTQLGRDVAIKVLPAAFVADRERLARFEREARLLAALNHPHIGAIYGIEQIDGVRALVLELVEGATLADRITRGAMPVADALPIARQIAEALEAAHEKGIVHRDLKPANIKIAPGGIVKVLDFGLAKMADSHGPDLSQSPTVTISGAHDGVLLGTVAYMSPEQARGQAVDKRADIWAFGCVLYEMLTGRPAFPGETVSDHIAAILEREPDWQALAATTPSAVQRLLRRCLEKDPKRRLHDIADARIEIDDAGTGTAPSATMLPIASSRRSGQLAWSFGALAAFTSALAGWTAWRLVPSSASSADRPLTRFIVQPPAAAPMVGESDISPDGSQLVYVGRQGGVHRLYLRRLDQFDVASLAGTEGASAPFFSSDGQWIGFEAGGKLKKISVTTSASPVVLCDAPNLVNATWSPNGTILFASDDHAVQRVSAEGGQPSTVTTLDRNEVDHHSPELLPGGQAVLFTIHQAEERFSIAVQSPSGQRKVIIDSGFNGRYSSSGHIVYARSSAILAVPFDLNRLAVTGAPVTLVEDVATVPRNGYGGFHLSRNGSLAFQPEPSLAGRVLTWVTRSGTETPLPIPPRSFMTPRVSTDGKTVAFAVADRERRDVWTYELATDKLARVTREGDNAAPLWTPDGRRLTYTSRRGDVQHLFWQPADGSGIPESLLTSRNRLWPNVWTGDNRTLIYVEDPPSDDFQIFVLRRDGEWRSQRLTHGPGANGFPNLSRDGRWLAFMSDETGRNEVYVDAFPALDSHYQVTVEGGREPVFSRDGRDLFYRSGSRMFAVPVDAGRTFSAGKPVRLFEGPFVREVLDYDVAPDGRFLMIRPSEEEQAPAHLNVVLNWVDELVRRVPSGK